MAHLVPSKAFLQIFPGSLLKNLQWVGEPGNIMQWEKLLTSGVCFGGTNQIAE